MATKKSILVAVFYVIMRGLNVSIKNTPVFLLVSGELQETGHQKLIQVAIILSS